MNGKSKQWLDAYTQGMKYIDHGMRAIKTVQYVHNYKLEKNSSNEKQYEI